MKQLVILSGKGGTGKTSITAAFAHLAAKGPLAGKVILADADVDAANLELVLQPTLVEQQDFKGGKVAVIDRKPAPPVATARRSAVLMRLTTLTVCTWSTQLTVTAAQPVSINAPPKVSACTSSWPVNFISPKAAMGRSIMPICYPDRKTPASW
jgi:Mrp family chromosome partitioning ATPase